MLSLVVLGSTCIDTLCRFVPSFRNGRAVGVKIFAVKPNTFYARAGLENADVIVAINGRDISSPDKALETYSALREARRVSVLVERRGRTLLIESDIALTLPGAAADARFSEFDSCLAGTRVETAYLDPWGRALVQAQPSPDVPSCKVSRGADGLLGSQDDLVLGCARVLYPDHVQNAWRLFAAGQACLDDVLLDAYGRRHIRIRPDGGAVMSWSLGPDGQGDTADDEVMLVLNRPCAERLLQERRP